MVRPLRLAGACAALLMAFVCKDAALAAADTSSIATLTAQTVESFARAKAPYIAVYDLVTCPLVTDAVSAMLSPGEAETELVRDVLAREANSGLTVGGALDIIGPADAFRAPARRTLAQALHVAINQKTPARGSPDTFVLHLGMTIDASLALRKDAVFSVVETYDEPNMRAIRIDSDDRPWSFYAVTGSADSLSAFRTALTVERWRAFTSRFETLTRFLPDLPFERSAETTQEARVADISPYTVESTASARQAIVENYVVGVDRARLHLTMDGRVFGSSVPRARPIGRMMPIPPENAIFRLATPMIYAIEDRKTGLILLMGEHG